MASGQGDPRKSDKLICDLCELEVETMPSKCMNCDIYMCGNCTKGHKKLKSTKDHKIIADQTGPLRLTKTKTMCKTHPEEDVTFYCKTCHLLICADCITGNHSSHKCTKIKDAAKQMEAELSKILAKVKDTNIPKIRSQVEKVDDLKETNVREGNAIVKKIKIRKDELVLQINKISDALVTESERSTEQNSKYLNQTHTRTLKDLSEMENLYDRYSRVLTKGSDVDKIQAHMDISKILDKLISHDFEVRVHFPTFTPNITSLQNAFGSLDTGEEQGSDFDYSAREPPTMEALDPSMSTNIDVKVTFTFKHNHRRVTSICNMTENAALIHCLDEYNNDIVNTEGQVQSVVELDYIVCDCAKTSSGFITTAIHSTFIHKLTVDGHIIDVFNKAPLEPQCLCVSSDGNILVTLYDEFSYDVNDDSRRLVARIDANTGQTIESYEYDRGTRLFTVPWGIDENTNGDICVVNRTFFGTGHLVILDNKGGLRVTYNGGIMDEQLDPFMVKCDEVGHIIVSDCGNKKIHLLSSDGQLVQYLMTDKELAHGPFSLAINQPGLLWVGCNNGFVFVVKYLK